MTEMLPKNNTLKLYKYTDKVCYLKQSYCNQMIHLSPLTELNDPFEGYSIIKQFPPDFVINNPEILKKMHLVFQENQPSITESEVIGLIQSDGFKSGLQKYEDMIRNYFEGFGITSFSSDPANLPMWAYYAKNHRGYCVEFEVDFDLIQKKTRSSLTEAIMPTNNIEYNDFVLPFFLNKNEFIFSKVKYTDQFPIIEYEKLYKMNSRYQRTDYIVRNSIGVKYNQWGHEDEYRLIANSNSKNAGLLSLKEYAPFLKFSGVIIGAKMEKKYINKIQEQQNKYGFNVKKAFLSDNSYGLIIK